MTEFHWKISKDQVNALDAIFIAAPRELSVKRFAQLAKRYLPKANIILGISDEPYVVGFEDQPQFKMLKLRDIEPIIDKVARSNSANKIYTLTYSQPELATILQKCEFRRVLLVNGSWKYAFHNLEAHQMLLDRGFEFKFISPFADESEAHAYEVSHTPMIDLPIAGALLSEDQMIQAADRAALQSFDNSFQTGVSLGRKTAHGYEYIASAFNEVIPYQAYALHHGNSREKHRARPHDTNHYDTIHAEMQLLTKALAGGIDLAGMTLFVNLLPCPNCARTLSQTPIVELVYVHDHSGGYAIDLLKLCGKKVRQLT